MTSCALFLARFVIFIQYARKDTKAPRRMMLEKGGQPKVSKKSSGIET